MGSLESLSRRGIIRIEGVAAEQSIVLAPEAVNIGLALAVKDDGCVRDMDNIGSDKDLKTHGEVGTIIFAFLHGIRTGRLSNCCRSTAKKRCGLP